MDSDNIPIVLKGNIESSPTGKEESLMASEPAEPYGKTVELMLIEVMLMKTKMHC